MDFFTTLMLLQLFLLQHKIRALKLRNITVPPYTFVNESAHLGCSYELESANLHSVTWYKDEAEFFKYEPKAINNRKTSSVSGVKLQNPHSDGRKVILQNINLQSTGVYKCDVIVDASNFPSVRGEAYMEVIVPPKLSPWITGEEKIYATGDILTLNCTSDKSYPPARISWFINGLQVTADSETSIQHHELYSTMSSLRLELGPDHLSVGQMVVRCEAVFSTSDRVQDPYVVARDTQVFVQGKSGATSPNTWLMAALLLHQIVHLGR